MEIRFDVIKKIIDWELFYCERDNVYENVEFQNYFISVDSVKVCKEREDINEAERYVMIKTLQEIIGFINECKIDKFEEIQKIGYEKFIKKYSIEHFFNKMEDYAKNIDLNAYQCKDNERLFLYGN